ncbi:YqzL family protein [Thalassobacillus devorans]|uniref:YqzL family protein n=1 Tax=Thalassobacillus devorans TaxID=279813 RepID=UPI000A1CCC39|nr:YqzL family protein [Thalassobacillus devorans]
MIALDNISWNIFRQSGSIEAYLLMKEMETIGHHANSRTNNLERLASSKKQNQGST